MNAFTIELSDSTFTVRMSEDGVFAAHAAVKNEPAFVECIADHECYKTILCQSHAHAIKIAVNLGVKHSMTDIEEFACWIEAEYPEDGNHA